MKYKYIYFDLDGTIIDSSGGVVECIKKSLSNYDLDKFNEETLKQTIIGPPLYEGLNKLLDTENTQLLNSLVYDFRQCYNSAGVYENKLYEGITNILKQLSLNSTLTLLTSKPEKFARIILQQHNISQYFTTIDGAGEKDTKSEKSQKLMYYTQNNKSLSIMIGDRIEDILAAKKADIDSLAVSYGFENIDMLTLHQPTYCADSTHDILSILKSV